MWKGASSAPSIAAGVQRLGVGKVRARCKPEEKLCVIEFDRVPDAKHMAVADKLAKAGYKVLSASAVTTGSKRYASEVRIRKA